MAERKQVEVEVDGMLVESPARVKTFHLPDVIDHRLDHIISEVRNQRGGVVSRTEVVGALLLELQPDPERIEAVVRSYRCARVRDGLLEPPSGRTVILDVPAPGPRSRRRG